MMVDEMYMTDEAKGKDWTLWLGDSCERMAEMADNSVDLSVSSPPFASLYVYSDSTRDLGNNSSREEFIENYGYIIRELLRVTKPGRIDATLNADVSFYDYLNVHPDADFKLVAQTEDASHVAIPVRKGDDSASLLEAINTAIEELRADGTLKALGEKYFGQDISSED